MKIFKTAMIATALCFLATAACAQNAKPADEPGKGRGKLENRVHAYISMRLAEELKLDQKTEAAFLSLLRRHFEEKQALTREQFEALRGIRDGLKSDTGDDKIRGLLDTLEKNRVKQSELEAKFFHELRKDLTPRQQAQLVILWPQLQEEVRQWIEGFRGQRNTKKIGPAPGKGPPPIGK